MVPLLNQRFQEVERCTDEMDIEDIDIIGLQLPQRISDGDVHRLL